MEETMSDDLKPCPFCNKAVIGGDETDENGFIQYCKNCGAVGPNELTSDLSAKMWNLRRPEDALRSELSAAKAERAHYGDIVTARIGELEAENLRLRAVLTKLPEFDGYGFCLVCENSRREGHAPDCQRQLALKGGEK
jgi:hypothetical protein